MGRRYPLLIEKGVVLDVAAGNGYMTDWLLQHGFEVTPMDKNTTQWRLPEVPCLECDLNKEIKAGANNYDMVVSIETIEHLENPFHFIREVARVMKPKGIAIIKTPNVHSIRSRLKYLFLGLPYLFEYVSDAHMGQHISPISIGHFLYAFRQAGMKIVDIYSTGPQSPFYL